MRVSIFRDVAAHVCDERELTPRQLVALITATKAASKHELPLLKLAAFGTKRSNKQSLRHDNNVLEVDGIECDYDAERVSFQIAVDKARAAGVTAILYTSPSHTPSAPRWRALFPLSAPVPPEQRKALADRANGIFDGVLAKETWTLSQAFYFGVVGDNFLLETISGQPLDTLTALPAKPYTRSENQKSKNPSSIDDLPAKLKRAIKLADPEKIGFRSRSEMVFYVACALVRLDWSDDRIAALLVNPDFLISAHVRDQSSPNDYARRQAQDARTKVGEWVYGKDGISPNNQKNIETALRTLGARFNWNAFTSRGYVNGIGPNRPLNDHEVNELRLAIDREFNFLPNKDFFYDMLDHLTHNNPHHPVIDYLDSLKWDGKPRLDTWLSYYGGASDNEYTRAVGHITLVAACRRIREPGCKFDEMLIFVNPDQGTNKSLAIKTLAIDPEWFSDSMPLYAKDKEVIEHLAGRWIIENAELNGIKHNQIEEIKAFLSRDTDRARLAYGRMTTEAPRQCIFIGTTNSESFLRDSQNRRFWPVMTTRFDIEALSNDVDQLWAEASHYERLGESIRLESELWGIAADVQAEYRQQEPWTIMISDVLQDMEGKIAISDLWMIINKPGYMRSQLDNQRLGEVMRELGFERRKARTYNVLKWCYVRGESEHLRQRQIYVFREPNTNNPVAGYSPELTYDNPNTNPLTPADFDL